MSTPRVDAVAMHYNVSNNEAKRLLGLKHKKGSRRGGSSSAEIALPARGLPVAGTGKPKNASKK